MYAPLGKVRKTAGKMLNSWKEIGSGDGIKSTGGMLFVDSIYHWAMIIGIQVNGETVSNVRTMIKNREGERNSSMNWATRCLWFSSSIWCGSLFCTSKDCSLPQPRHYWLSSVIVGRMQNLAAQDEGAPFA